MGGVEARDGYSDRVVFSAAHLKGNPGYDVHPQPHNPKNREFFS